MRRIALTLLLTTVLAGSVTTPIAGQEGPPPTPVPPFGSPSPYPSSLTTPEPSERPPRLTAGSVVLVDLDSGSVLYGAEDRRPRPVASTTKVMTALLVLESTRPSDIVTVTPNAVSSSGAGLGLEVGERVSVRQLLYGLMLQSANDAALALAEHVAGSVDEFVRLMNLRARQLGLEDTDFRSPHGLNDAGRSTARDLALITVEAYRWDLFARVAATRFRTIPAPSGPDRRIQNRNALLWLYPGAIGVKTGWTSAAGFCLVSAAERDGLRLVGVVLGSPREALTDSATLLDHGFAALERRELVGEGHEVQPLHLQGREVRVGAGSSLEALVRREQEPVLLVRAHPGLSLPLGEGDTVGAIEVLVRGERVGEVPLVVLEAVDEADGAGSPTEPARPWWSVALEWGTGLLDAFRGILS